MPLVNKHLLIQLKAALDRLEGINTVEIYAKSES